MGTCKHRSLLITIPLILEKVSERQLDIVMDHLFTLNEHTPKLRCQGKQGIDPSLIFGLDSKLWLDPASRESVATDHHSEVETATIRRGVHGRLASKCSDESCAHDHQKEHTPSGGVILPLTRDVLSNALDKLPKESVYRVKGYVHLATGKARSEAFILNWAFGRWNLTPFEFDDQGKVAEGYGLGEVLLTMMGERGEIKRGWAKRLAEHLQASVE